MFLRSALVLGSLVFLSALPAQADPAAELAGFSAFPTADLTQLKGDAKPVRGPAMSNSRFQSVQTCWVSPGSPAQVGTAIKNFNPARVPELKVLLQVNSSNFSALSSAPNNAAVQWLKDATEKKSTELQLSRDEAAKSAPFAQFWSGVLSARAAAGFSGPSYDHTGKNIRPGEELNALLSQQPKIRKQFGGLGGKGEPYWELLEIEGKGVLALGSTSSHGTSNGGIQIIDALYYSSGGFYAGLTLYQLWPVQLDGKPATLVWRGDLISSGEIADLRGIERMGSETAMIKDVSRSVRILRSSLGGR